MSITRYIPCGSDAIIFGSKIFLANGSVFQISHDKNHPFLILKNNVTTKQQQHIKMNKTSVVFLNGPFYIFEVDNIIIIYNLLLSLLQKK